jgi:NADH-quinone oxidoreductase subunit L
MTLRLLWIIQLAPLAAFILIAALPKSIRKTAPAIGVLGALAAAVASLQLWRLHPHAEGFSEQFVYQWLKAFDHHTLVVGFLLDPLNLLMITLVTTISFFVQLFSVYYMFDDSSRARYFGFLSFFSFSMTGLVLSNNLLQTFLFWELVGLTSYLLIGFWCEKNSAVRAAKKAFVVNRLGDLGFYLGVILLFSVFGSLQFTDLTSEALKNTFSPQMLAIIGILVFMGVMGKSAQFPLHAWLPDAMEGPTPVSALIHSATMVAAGVFLLSRSFGLFGASEATLWTVLTIGACTAFVGASVATVQRDIKKIMAYSTISQLGLMVMSIGAGSTVAGMFHLSTHAYFKSLLFLTSGAFIHHFHSNDIWEIGKKGGKKDLLAMAALCVGLFSLCGIFPFSGFFSKDMILETIHEKSIFFYAVALLVSFLTVYYSFRMFFVIAFAKVDPERMGHSHAAHPEPGFLKWAKAIPLVGLAAISLYVGALGTPLLKDGILHWLGSHHGSHWNWTLFLTTGFLIVSGALVAYFQFRNPEKALAHLTQSRHPIKILLERKFYIDELYEFLVEEVSMRLARLFNWFDHTFINALLVNQSAYSVLRLGRVAAKIQSGLLQDYLSLAIGAGILIIFWILKTV